MATKTKTRSSNQAKSRSNRTTSRPAAKKTSGSSRTASSKARGTSRSATSRAGGSTAGKSTARSSAGKRSKTTTDHEEIQRWAEARNAHPSRVKGTGRKKGDVGMVRLDFPGFSGEGSLQEISWDEFFKAFDENNLAFLYQEKTAGGKRSNFNKFVSRGRT